MGAARKILNKRFQVTGPLVQVHCGCYNDCLR